MKGGEGMERANEREGGEKSENRQRENRHVIVSRGKQKRSQFTELRCLHWDHGRPWLCVCLWQSDGLARTHTQPGLLLCTVCVSACVYISICMWLSWGICPLRRTGVSMERGACWWACLGWGPSFDTGAEGNLCSLRNVENQAVLVRAEIWTAAGAFWVWKCKAVQKIEKEVSVFIRGWSVWLFYLLTLIPCKHINWIHITTAIFSKHS